MTDVERLDRKMMDVALRAAARGRPSPNPHVGAVVVQDGRVVGVGHHERAGEAHAEVVALGAAGTNAVGATLYVTFEPCNHHGRTPPCTDAILRAGIRRVVVGCADPAPHVPGASERLRRAGVDVVVGVLERRAMAIVEDFAKHITTGMPYVTLKSAVTLDGRTATRTGDSRWITGAAARKDAHRLRDASDGVLIGVGTALADDPLLTVRHVRGRTPPRIVLDTHARLSPRAKLVASVADAPTWLVHGPDAPAARTRALADAGATLIEVATTPTGRVNLVDALRAIGARNVVRLLVEGGAEVHGAMLREGLADRVVAYIAPAILGDAAARGLAEVRDVTRISEAIRLRDVTLRRLGDDVRLSGRITPREVECSPGS